MHNSTRLLGFGGKTEEVTVLKMVIEHPEINDADAWGADQWSELKQYLQGKDLDKMDAKESQFEVLLWMTGVCFEFEHFYGRHGNESG